MVSDDGKWFAIRVLEEYLSEPGDWPVTLGSPQAQAFVRAQAQGEEVPLLEEKFDAWLERQVGLALEARELVDALEQKCPSPTVEDIEHGEPEWPPYQDAKWWMVLNHYPLALELPTFLEEARRVLEEMK